MPRLKLRPYRYTGPGYLPFTEKLYTGGYPFPPPEGRSGFRFGLREAVVFANRNTLFRNGLNNPLLHDRKTYLKDYEDRRLFHPTGAAPFRSLRQTYVPMLDLEPIDPKRWERIGRIRKIDWKTRSRVDATPRIYPGELGFHSFQRMVICMKRKIRREVLHALNIAGKSGQFNPRSQNPYHYVRCY